jgi:hypothetical protein
VKDLWQLAPDDIVAVRAMKAEGARTAIEKKQTCGYSRLTTLWQCWAMKAEVARTAIEKKHG